MTPFASYFDRVAVINLPTRGDRRRSILGELQLLGFDPARVEIPPAPIPTDNGGFPSRGVYGNYLSHLSILKDAEAAAAERVLVLEDDAIFSRAARNPARQAKAIAEASQYDWAMWYLGHKLRERIAHEPRGVIPNTMEFHWAHAYAVQRDSLPELIAFLELLMSRPSGDPRGGPMYIDGAFYHYRAEATAKPCVVSNPPLSVQKGSDSNLAGPLEPGRLELRDYPKHFARSARDEFWRWTDVHILTAANERGSRS